MKTPEPSKENPSAPNTRIFTYPKRLASACAEVLARLLAGEVLTSADTLEQCPPYVNRHVHVVCLTL